MTLEELKSFDIEKEYTEKGAVAGITDEQAKALDGLLKSGELSKSGSEDLTKFEYVGSKIYKDNAPVEVFPSKWCENDIFLRYCKEVARAYQVPLEFVVLPFLASVAACMQGNTAVQVTKEWIEFVCLWVVCAAESGERKSPVFREIMRYIEEYEEERREKERAGIRFNRSERDRLVKILKSGASEEERKEAAEQLENIGSTEEFQMILDNSTVEAATSALAAQKEKGCCFASAEGDIFNNLSKQYSNTIDCNSLLKAYTGETIRVKRVGRQEEYIKNPRLSMVLFTQTAILERAFNTQTFLEKGFLQRFLVYKKPKRTAVRETCVEPVSENLKSAVREFYRYLLDRNAQYIYTLENDTKDGAFDAIQREIDERILSEKNDHVREYLSKGAGMVITLAGILHGLNVYKSDNPCNTKISESEIETAKSIYDFCFFHFVSMAGDNAETPEGRDAEKVLDFIKAEAVEKQNGNVVTHTTVFRKFHGWSAKRLQEAICFLISSGYLQKEERELNYNNRKITVYRINPSAI